MKNVAAPITNQLHHPKEFLNVIAYSEMKRQGMTNQEIMHRYKIKNMQLHTFKKKHGLIGMKRGDLYDHLQALQSPTKKFPQHCR